jgi:hypothetical protein
MQDFKISEIKKFTEFLHLEFRVWLVFKKDFLYCARAIFKR